MGAHASFATLGGPGKNVVFIARPKSCAKIKLLHSAAIRHIDNAIASQPKQPLIDYCKNVSRKKPNAARVADITYIGTLQSWLNLTVFLNLFSHKVIGWSMKLTLAKEILLDVILMAL
jgi:hypothetical protein